MEKERVFLFLSNIDKISQTLYNFSIPVSIFVSMFPIFFQIYYIIMFIFFLSL